MTPSLTARMEQLQIFERDLAEQFILGSGAGGQKINKTASCVLLTHRPTGIQVRCQSGRSRSQNRIEARETLCSLVETQRRKAEHRVKANIAKRRFATKKRSARQKREMRKNKTFRSEKKQNRQRVRF